MNQIEKIQRLKRVPPGDKWIAIEGDGNVLESLTDGIEYIFQRHGSKQFFVDAGLGIVYSVESETEVVEQPQTKYSIYGE
mgnify:FL=1